MFWLIHNMWVHVLLLWLPMSKLSTQLLQKRLYQMASNVTLKLFLFVCQPHMNVNDAKQAQ